jgi:hypothetical protein
MKQRKIAIGVVVSMCVLSMMAGNRFAGVLGAASKEASRLAVVWTSGDPDVAHRMVFMYVHASQNQKWFDENLVIVWGPSSRLLAENEELQAEVREMMKDGVKFQACIVCANMYGVAEKLRDMGIEVKGMGKPLTELLQDDGWDVMTF